MPLPVKTRSATCSATRFLSVEGIPLRPRFIHCHVERKFKTHIVTLNANFGADIVIALEKI